MAVLACTIHTTYLLPRPADLRLHQRELLPTAANRAESLYLTRPTGWTDRAGLAAACRYSWRMPPRRSRLWTRRPVAPSASGDRAGNGRSGRARPHLSPHRRGDHRPGLPGVCEGRPGRFSCRMRGCRLRPGARRAMTGAGYAGLITAAHRYLDAPVLVIWDNLPTHLSRKMRAFTAGRPDWLTVIQLPGLRS